MPITLARRDARIRYYYIGQVLYTAAAHQSIGLRAVYSILTSTSEESSGGGGHGTERVVTGLRFAMPWDAASKARICDGICISVGLGGGGSFRTCNTAECTASE